MERVYSRAWYIKEREGFRKCKESSSRIWEENKYRNKKTRYGRRERF